MKKSTLTLMLMMILATAMYAQQNFTISPEKPKPGDLIKITYTPAGELANTLGKVEGVVYTYGSTGRYAEDLVLTKSGKKYTATVATDTSLVFIQFGFYIDAKYDNNYNEGYFTLLYDGDKPRKDASQQQAIFHEYTGQLTRVDKDMSKAQKAIEQEFERYPSQRKKHGAYYYHVLEANKTDIVPLVQKEIESALKEGLKTEKDYTYLTQLYNTIKLPQQGKFLDNVAAEKFPDGEPGRKAMVMKYREEQDATKKDQLFAVIEKRIASDPAWKPLEYMINNHKLTKANAAAKTKDWENYRALMSQVSDKSMIAANYNSRAWDMQEKNDDLKLAEEFSSWATEYAKAQVTNPTRVKPTYITQKEWTKSLEREYAMYADTYAMVLYKSGDFKKGFEFAKAAALEINKGMDVDLNNTYSLLAEKSLQKKDLKLQLEKFVKDGKTNGTINGILKKIYVEDTKSENGFDDYIVALGKESYLKMLEELKKSMINETSPSFTLNDMNGKPVNIADLKGKIVVVDFWATWCGPCKASFPGMQKMVTKYKENPDVKFLFVDTWERSDDKLKNASEFITTNKYTFDVLMDTDNKVVAQFKVDGIPTKFVIDREGKIRFKSVGFSGSDEKLISELTAMIEMADDKKSNP